MGTGVNYNGRYIVEYWHAARSVPKLRFVTRRLPGAAYRLCTVKYASLFILNMRTRLYFVYVYALLEEHQPRRCWKCCLSRAYERSSLLIVRASKKNGPRSELVDGNAYSPPYFALV